MPDQKTRNTRRKAPQPNLETIGLEIGKVPPQALDVEEAVLGAMLLEPSCVDAALEELTPSCFYSEKHRMIFDAMSSLVLEHVSVDFITVSSKLKERGDLVFVIASALLAGLVFLADHLIKNAGVTEDIGLMFLHRSFARVSWMGGDYFPLIPYLGYAFAGAAVITLFYGGGKSLLPRLDGGWNKPFRFVGKHTLLIVIVHQVANMLILAVVTALFVDTGNFVIF